MECHSLVIESIRLQMGSVSARNTVVAFHLESKCIIIYIFPKNGSGKGIVLNINHDIIPQVICKTLVGVSREENK